MDDLTRRLTVLQCATQLHSSADSHATAEQVTNTATALDRWVTKTTAEDTPPWAQSLAQGLAEIRNRQETEMALTEDLAAAIADLQAENGVVISALDDLLAKANARGSVSDTDVQAAVDAVKAEVARIGQAVQTDDPGVIPPAPAGP